ncbi:hypothetical protein [Plantactinospora sp. GCM10030261]
MSMFPVCQLRLVVETEETVSLAERGTLPGFGTDEPGRPDA